MPHEHFHHKQHACFPVTQMNMQTHWAPTLWRSDEPPCVTLPQTHTVSVPPATDTEGAASVPDTVTDGGGGYG